MFRRVRRLTTCAVATAAAVLTAARLMARLESGRGVRVGLTMVDRIALRAEVVGSAPRLAAGFFRVERIAFALPVGIRLGGGVLRPRLAGMDFLGERALLPVRRTLFVLRTFGIRFVGTRAGRTTGRGREDTRLARCRLLCRLMVRFCVLFMLALRRGALVLARRWGTDLRLGAGLPPRICRDAPILFPGKISPLSFVSVYR